jgi:hypothetical protein
MRNVLNTSGASLLLPAIVACSTAEVDRDMIRSRLEFAVGRQLEETVFSKPTAATRSVTTEAAVGLEHHVFTWSNGCSYVVDVDAISRRVKGWHFASEERLCREIPRTPLGS